MIYNSFNFLVLFPLIFLLYYVIPAKFQKWRKFTRDLINDLKREYKEFSIMSVAGAGTGEESMACKIIPIDWYYFPLTIMIHGLCCAERGV